jgi:hypothetical protein
MRRARRALFVAVFASLILVGCAEGSGDLMGTTPDLSHVPAADLVPVHSAKTDGLSFNPNHIMEDWLFEDAALVTTEQVQAFFEDSPYGTRSFLADHEVDGVSVAELLVFAAEASEVSPLILLTRLQVEQALVFLVETPSQSRLDKAMGCGCPDDGPCNFYESGLARQINCSAALMRQYLEELEYQGQTVTGWRVGVPKLSADGVSVTPGNRATASLYTYTPWTLVGEGGNWLFSNIYTKFAAHILEASPNHHWIGGECTQNEGCPFPDGMCMDDVPDGSCTSYCTGSCPDVDLHSASVTFCVDMDDQVDGEPVGRCVSRCDQSLYPMTNGCREGYNCVDTERFQDSDTAHEACLPAP